ncbi:MAG: hypothetical protein KIS92_02670 [Planctomycetota bacterium]|nr:hypothetical protein [Planctomycetota bacterium]
MEPEPEANPEPQVSSNPFERVPPHDRRAERGVLGAMLCDGRSAQIADEDLVHEDFYDLANQRLFKLFHDLIQEGHDDMDLIVVEAEMVKRRVYEHIGGNQYLRQLVYDTPTAANIERYIRIVKEFSLKRRLMNLAHNLVKQVVNTAPDSSAKEILEEAEQKVYDLAAQFKGVNDEPSNLQVLADEIAHNALNDIRPRPGLQLGMAEGAIDDLLGGLGLEPFTYIVLAARTSTGKTTFCSNVAMKLRANNIDSGCPLIVSTEASQYSIARQCLAAATGIHTRALSLCNLTDNQKAAVEKSVLAKPLDGIYSIYCPGKTIAQIRAIAKRHKAYHGLPLMIVDLAGKLKGKGEKEYDRLSYISAGLSELKAELETTIIACVQISRGVFQSEDRRPELQHLKGSGGWEEDADMVWFLHRPAHVSKSTDPRTEVICAKDREHGDRANKSVWIEWKAASGQYIWPKENDNGGETEKHAGTQHQTAVGMDDSGMLFGPKGR